MDNLCLVNSKQNIRKQYAHIVNIIFCNNALGLVFAIIVFIICDSVIKVFYVLYLFMFKATLYTGGGCCPLEQQLRELYA